MYNRFKIASAYIIADLIKGGILDDDITVFGTKKLNILDE